MSKIVWDALGERMYELGLDHGVLYLPDVDGYTNGVAWNGLTKVTDPVLVAEANDLYSGDVKVDSIYKFKDYTGTIEAYTYPDEFEQCLGLKEAYPGVYANRQEISDFGLSYRTLVGSDVDSESSYKIHLLYNLKVTKFEQNYSTVTDSTSVDPMSWDYEAYSGDVDDYTDYGPIKHLIINTAKCDSGFVKYLERVLYGTDESDPRLISPDEVFYEYYRHHDIWEGYPAPAIYPSNTIYPQHL